MVPGRGLALGEHKAQVGRLAFTGTVWARGQETGSFKELTVLRGKYSSDYWQLWQRKLSSWPRSRASAVGWVDPVLGAGGTTNQDEALWPPSRGLWRQTQDELARGQKGGREERRQAGGRVLAAELRGVCGWVRGVPIWV